MEHDLITRTDVEEQVCPVLLQLTEPNSGDDYRTEAVTVGSLILYTIMNIVILYTNLET